MYEKKGDFTHAESILFDCLSLDPNNSKALIAHGNLCLARKDKKDEEKLEDAEVAFGKLPDSDEYSCLSLGAIYIQKFLAEKRADKLVLFFF